MGDLPLVSVLVTSYNREKYIAETIESILASSYNYFELIIMDDCSTDNTVSIARQYEVKDSRIKVFVNEKNRGQFVNRNIAAAKASGKYLKYFDSDDVMHNNMLEVMVNGMQKFPSAGLGATCEWYKIKDAQMPVQFSSRATYVNHFFYGSSLLYAGPSATIYKRELFDSLGGFNESIGILADTLLSFQIAARTPVVCLKKNLFFWRIHNEQVTVGQLDLYEMCKERFKINELALSDKNCPFNGDEKELVKRNLKNIFIRDFFKFFKSTKTSVQLNFLYKMYQVKPVDILKALIPNKILKA
jgi:glycosyltransferase involved in cell wall biosynthesis